MQFYFNVHAYVIELWMRTIAPYNKTTNLLQSVNLLGKKVGQVEFPRGLAEWFNNLSSNGTRIKEQRNNRNKIRHINKLRSNHLTPWKFNLFSWHQFKTKCRWQGWMNSLFTRIKSRLSLLATFKIWWQCNKILDKQILQCRHNTGTSGLCHRSRLFQQNRTKSFNHNNVVTSSPHYRKALVRSNANSTQIISRYFTNTT